jgi:hypothetical protein
MEEQCRRARNRQDVSEASGDLTRGADTGRDHLTSAGKDETRDNDQAFIDEIPQCVEELRLSVDLIAATSESCDLGWTEAWFRLAHMSTRQLKRGSRLKHAAAQTVKPTTCPPNRSELAPSRLRARQSRSRKVVEPKS